MFGYLEIFLDISFISNCILIHLWPGKDILYNSNFYKFIEIDFMGQKVVCRDKCSMHTWKECLFYVKEAEWWLQRYQGLIRGACNCCLIRENGFANVSKLRILRQLGYPGCPGASNVIRGALVILIRVTRRRQKSPWRSCGRANKG